MKGASVNTPRVSILVPIMNVEKYLRECLESLVNQTLQDIQIICLDDGSTDSSPAIIEEFRQRDPRIEVITKPNSGYGDSMNKGLALARGEYVGIVESDDFADPDMFEYLYELAVTHSADLVKSNYYEHKSTRAAADDPVVNMLKHCKKEEVFTPRVDQEIFIAKSTIWSAIYKRSFLIENEINFLPTPGASFQDTSFNLKTLIAAERAVATDRAFLHYRIDNEGSSVKSRAKAFFICEEYEEVWGYLSQRPEAYEALKTKIPRVQLGVYLWNLDRLSPELQYSFYEQFVKEFRVFQEQDFLDESEHIPFKWELLQGMLRDPEGHFVKHYGPIKVDTSYVLCAGEASAAAYGKLIDETLEKAGENSELLCIFNTGDSRMLKMCKGKRDADKRVFFDDSLKTDGLGGRVSANRLRGGEVIFAAAQAEPQRDVAVVRMAKKLSESKPYRRSQKLIRKTLR